MCPSEIDLPDLPEADSFTQGEIDVIATSDPELDQLAELTLDDVYALVVDNNQMLRPILGVMAELQQKVSQAQDAVPAAMEKLRCVPFIGSAIANLLDSE